MEDLFKLYVVFFFDKEEALEKFLLVKDFDLCVARRLYRTRSTEGPNLAEIVELYGILTPIVVIYPLYDKEAVVLRVGDYKSDIDVKHVTLD